MVSELLETDVTHQVIKERMKMSGYKLKEESGNRLIYMTGPTLFTWGGQIITIETRDDSILNLTVENNPAWPEQRCYWNESERFLRKIARIVR